MSLLSHIRTAAVAAVLVALAPGLAQAKWLRAESAHFIVYANADEPALRDYARRMENYDHLLRVMHRRPEGADASNRLEIYLVNGPADLRKVFPEMGKDWAGVYTASVNGVFAVAIKPSQIDHGEYVRHEYYHHFMLQNYPGAYPVWMIEGMAQFFSNVGWIGGKMAIGGEPPGSLDILAVEGWLPLEEVLAKGPFQFKESLIRRYYSEAWLLTNYMMTDLGRRKQLVAYVDAVRGGEDSVKAWTRVVGESPDETQKKLHNLRLKGLVVDKEAASTTPITVSPMPNSAEDMLLEGEALKHGVSKDDGPAILADIRADAAKHPDDRLSDLVLARAEMDLGDIAKVEPLMKRRLAADANDNEARLIQAQAWMKQGDADPKKRTDFYRQADRLLVSALKTNDRDFRLLHAYAKSRSIEPGYPSANMVAVLMGATALAPQVNDLRFEAANASAAHGDYGRAILVLEPMLNDPHRPVSAMAARDLVADLKLKAAAAAADNHKPAG